MRNPQKSLPVIIIISLLSVCFSGWIIIRQLPKVKQAKNESSYDTTQVRRMDLSEKIDATGDVVTEKNASMYPPYSTTVKEIRVKPGDTVHKGDILLVLQLKDADLINYAATWKSSLDQAQDNLTVAQRALERQQTLYKIQGTTIDELESAQKAVKEYQSQITEYKLKLASLTKNGVDDQNNVLIRAPYDSEISWINVKLEEAVTTTNELLTLGGASALQVEANIDQGDISQIVEGQPASITANDENRTIIPGVVTSFGSTGTTSSNVVTFPVMITPSKMKKPDFVNQNGKATSGFQKSPQPKNKDSEKMAQQNLGQLLKSGMTVDVSIMINCHPNVLAIPIRAVTEVDGQTIVRVLNQGKYVTKKVQLGFKNEKFAEVLAGLAEGDLVAILKNKSPYSGGSPNSTKSGGNLGGQMGPPPM